MAIGNAEHDGRGDEGNMPAVKIILQAPALLIIAIGYSSNVSFPMC